MIILLEFDIVLRKQIRSEGIKIIEFYLESHLRAGRYLKATLVMVSFRQSLS